jgi:putative sporulation protein YtxC
MQRVLQMRSKFDCFSLFANRFDVEKQKNKLYNIYTVTFDDFDLFNTTICECIYKFFAQPYFNYLMTFETNCFRLEQKKLIYDEVMENSDFDMMKQTVSIITCANTVINIEGIYCFRLKEWNNKFKDVCKLIADKYILKNEYTEFVKMLRFFVTVNEGTTDVINVVMKSDDMADIFDADFKEINDNEFLFGYEFAFVGEAYKQENAVSKLVELSPGTIYIHNWKKYKHSKMLDTIVNVFGDKVVFCDGCIHCMEENDK